MKILTAAHLKDWSKELKKEKKKTEKRKRK